MRPNRIRSFNGAQIEFDFPVTALIGPNGGGKTTILGAAACAYKNIRPRIFFPKSSIGDDTMANWSVEYELIDKKIRHDGTTQRTARFRNLKWVRDNFPSRPVRYFGILRTVPAAEKPEFKKVTQRSFAPLGPLEQIPANVAQEAQRILGKPLTAFKRTSIGKDKTFYIGGDGQLEYSEFHFGAGEASVIRMMAQIENLPENSLVLIEEIENGLHPVATKRMVEYLVHIAERKKIQSMFTTHSNAALEPLPPEAIWAAFDGSLRQGKLSIEALRALSGRVDKRLAIFVEDEFAKTWLEWMIRKFSNDSVNEVGVYAVAGDGNAVRLQKSHRDNPAVETESLCYIDGDSGQEENQDQGVFRLPGQMPESTIFSYVEANLDRLAAVLTVACHLEPAAQERVKRAVGQVSLENRDPHTLFADLGIKLGFLPEELIRSAFVNLWIENNREESKSVVERINEVLNKPT